MCHLPKRPICLDRAVVVGSHTRKDSVTEVIYVNSRRGDKLPNHVRDLLWVGARSLTATLEELIKDVIALLLLDSPFQSRRQFSGLWHVPIGAIRPPITVASLTTPARFPFQSVCTL